MHLLRRLPYAAFVLAAVACAHDSPTEGRMLSLPRSASPGANTQRTFLTREIAVLNQWLTSNARAAKRHEQTLDSASVQSLVNLRARFQAQLAAIPADQGPGASFDALPPEVDAAGVITSATTSIYLGQGEASASVNTDVSVPAVITMSVSGNATSNGIDTPISANFDSSVPTVGFAEQINPLPNVNCHSASATVTASTQHTAGWNVKGVGFTPANAFSSDGKSCEPQFVKVTPSSATVGIGSTTQLSASITRSDGSVVAGSPNCDWSSSSPSIASVASDGTVTGVATGSATIEATCWDWAISGTANVTVVQADQQCVQASHTGFARRTTDCTPSGGGTGGGSNSSDCGWYEYEISYDGGLTWYPYGDPFWYCPDGSVNQTATGPGARTNGGSLQRDSTYQVTLFGTTVSSDHKVIAYRDLKHAGNPIVVIDTSRASATDLEGALQAVHEIATFTSTDARVTHVRLETTTQPHSTTAKNRIDNEDAKLLRDLEKSALGSVDGLGRGRLMDASISRSRQGKKGGP